MSYWDSTRGTIVRYPDQPYPHYPGWLLVNCSCCGGLQWGGESPVECRHCGGTGNYAKHVATGTRALYPGGPLLGREGS